MHASIDTIHRAKRHEERNMFTSAALGGDSLVACMGGMRFGLS